MPKTVIGYIYNHKGIGIEEKKFFKIAKKMNIELVPFNLSEQLDEKDIEAKAKRCDILFSDTNDSMVIELVKTVEALGKRVIEPSKVFYYPEDKWIFFLECKKHKIPTPETILLSDNLESARKELENFNQWPVVLKRVYGCRGEFVDKADNLNDAIWVIKNFWKKGNERLPILAQEFVLSDSYRVTVMGKEIVQTALKKRHGWKATGCYATKFRKFKVDPELKKIVEKVMKITKIHICGVDLAKKNGRWLVIEANAEPSFKMFDCEYDIMIKKALELLRKEAGKKNSKSKKTK